MSLIVIVVLSIFSAIIISCSKNTDDTYLQELSNALENLEKEIPTLAFSEIIPSYDTINKDLFKIISDAKTSKALNAHEEFRYNLQAWLTKFHIEDVSEIDSLFGLSFLTSTKDRNLREKLIICDVYSGFINSNKVQLSDKKRLLITVTVYRDFALYFEGDKLGDSKRVEDDEYGKRNRAYWLSRCALGDTSWEYCWDCCMRETWDDMNPVDWAFCAGSFLYCMFQKASSCAYDCSITEEEAAK